MLRVAFPHKTDGVSAATWSPPPPVNEEPEKTARAVCRSGARRASRQVSALYGGFIYTPLHYPLRTSSALRWWHSSGSRYHATRYWQVRHFTPSWYRSSKNQLFPDRWLPGRSSWIRIPLTVSVHVEYLEPMKVCARAQSSCSMSRERRRKCNVSCSAHAVSTCTFARAYACAYARACACACTCACACAHVMHMLCVRPCMLLRALCVPAPLILI